MTHRESVGLEAGTHTQDRNEEKDNHQDYGQLEEGLLHTAARTDDGASPCAESAFSPRLDEDDDDQGHGDDDLDDAKVVLKLHILSPLLQGGRARSRLVDSAGHLVRRRFLLHHQDLVHVIAVVVQANQGLS